MEPVRSDDFYQLIKPQLCGLLDLLRIGVVFERARGDYLYHRRDGEEIGVLDLVGGYGSLLFGHHHPVLVAEAQRLLAEGRPIHSQGSRHDLAGRLARELSRRAGGDYRVVFTNSGAEAVEAAMKHAILETGSRTFIALRKGLPRQDAGRRPIDRQPGLPRAVRDRRADRSPRSRQRHRAPRADVCAHRQHRRDDLRADPGRGRRSRDHAGVRPARGGACAAPAARRSSRTKSRPAWGGPGRSSRARRSASRRTT